MDLNALSDAALALLVNVLAAATILAVGWWVAGWVARTIARATSTNQHLDRTIASVFAKIARYAILIFTIVAVLNRFGVQTTSVVALLGAAGLAIGLALQGALANVASGVMLLGLRPFRLGDAVEIAGTVGAVEEIGLFATRLRTFDGVVVHQPNSRIWGTEIKNYSQAERRRADLIVGISYGDDIAQAVAIASEMLNADERVLRDPEPIIKVDSLGDSSVNLILRFWTLPADLFQTRWDLTRAVKERFDDGGISIPFPQRDLHLIQDAPVRVASSD
ncbi:MAG: mechanosensitive ion channel domain-containing protein [Trueperaceae bacterium]